MLDNGRRDGSDGLVWVFRWSRCPGARWYHLYVINDRIVLSFYRYRSHTYGITHRFGWRWRVRANVNGRWSAWSEERIRQSNPTLDGLGELGY
jgi:hypothetical protein